MKMKRFALAASLVLPGPALAEGREPGPAFKPGWDSGFTLAAVGGEMDVDGAGKGFYSGLELSLDCPWPKPPKGMIRQQFNVRTMTTAWKSPATK